MATNNVKLTCGRCPAVVASIVQLEAHLVETHCMGAAQAQREARAARTARNGQLGIAVALPAPVSAPSSHTCPGCHMEIPCDWRAVAEMEDQARRLRAVGAVWRRRLQGLPVGRLRQETFDIEQARQMIAAGMSYRAVAKVFQVGHGAVYNAVNKMARVKTGA